MKTIDIYRFRRLLVFPTLISLFSVVTYGIVLTNLESNLKKAQEKSHGLAIAGALKREQNPRGSQNPARPDPGHPERKEGNPKR